MFNSMKRSQMAWLIGLAAVALTASSAQAQRHSARMGPGIAFRQPPPSVHPQGRAPMFLSPRQFGTNPFVGRQFDRFEDRFDRSPFFGRFDRFEDRFERRFGFDPFLARRFGFDPLFLPGSSVFPFLP
jgi:hypothetical protein